MNVGLGEADAEAEFCLGPHHCDDRVVVGDFFADTLSSLRLGVELSSKLLWRTGIVGEGEAAIRGDVDADAPSEVRSVKGEERRVPPALAVGVKRLRPREHGPAMVPGGFLQGQPQDVQGEAALWDVEDACAGIGLGPHRKNDLRFVRS